jgi:hypothetical protein
MDYWTPRSARYGITTAQHQAFYTLHELHHYQPRLLYGTPYSTLHPLYELPFLHAYQLAIEDFSYFLFSL